MSNMTELDHTKKAQTLVSVQLCQEISQQTIENNITSFPVAAMCTKFL